MLMILEPIQEHIFLGPSAALAAYYLFSVPPYIFIPLHFISWLLADYLLLIVMQVRLTFVWMYLLCRIHHQSKTSDSFRYMTHPVLADLIVVVFDIGL